jgi:hypothetical protein
MNISPANNSSSPAQVALCLSFSILFIFPFFADLH